MCVCVCTCRDRVLIISAVDIESISTFAVQLVKHFNSHVYTG